MMNNNDNFKENVRGFRRQVLSRTAIGSLMVLAFATIGSVNAFVVPSLTKKALWNNNSNNNVNVNVNVNDSNSKRLSSSGSGSGLGSCLWAASSSSSGEEYASLQVGQVVSVRVGDLRSGRKAWKKRRRSDSPILVPCSILGMNRYSMIVYNIRTVLYKYGEYPKSTTVQNIHNHQIQLSLSRVKKLYKRDTGSPLLVRPHHTHTYIHTLLLLLYNYDSKLESHISFSHTTTIHFASSILLFVFWEMHFMQYCCEYIHCLVLFTYLFIYWMDGLIGIESCK